jgi:hypothetical protein
MRRSLAREDDQEGTEVWRKRDGGKERGRRERTAASAE